MKPLLLASAVILIGCVFSGKEEKPEDKNPCTVTKAIHGMSTWYCPSKEAPICHSKCSYTFSFANGSTYSPTDSIADTLQNACFKSRYDGIQEGYIWPSCDTLPNS
jgi:hypothetical protein